ncbi:hypothetical protein EHP00_1198 [Ecytonucleospora hepatopenaei]|uniref:Uncharacterized protein n=1 Tax=Ecytonucleospora hepatopenaei TaxID=646526 RepID=A0A1W0E870_9MICR|nr:hypothetical protein EHP00_1198 [Ecytonucleospora hepatopenaei]
MSEDNLSKKDTKNQSKQDTPPLEKTKSIESLNKNSKDENNSKNTLNKNSTKTNSRNTSNNTNEEMSNSTTRKNFEYLDNLYNKNQGAKIIEDTMSSEINEKFKKEINEARDKVKSSKNISDQNKSGGDKNCENSERKEINKKCNKSKCSDIDCDDIDNDDIERIYIKIMKKSGCDHKTALSAYKRANKNINNAIDIAKTEYRASLPTITEYKNGIQVNFKGKEIFYEKTTPKGAYLTDCLAKGEFDRKVLGLTGDFVDVIFVDLQKETKHIPKVYKPYKGEINRDSFNSLINEYSAVLPKTIQFDEKYDVLFKLCYQKHVSICQINKKSTLAKVFQYFKAFFEKNVKLVRSGEDLEEETNAKEIENDLIVLYVEK